MSLSIFWDVSVSSEMSPILHGKSETYDIPALTNEMVYMAQVMKSKKISKVILEPC